MFWTLMTALWVVMLLAPLALLVALLPTGRDCPRCGGETFAIRTALLRPVRRFLGRRWCTSCGWEGVTRLPLHPRPVLEPEPVRVEPEDADDDAVWRGERDNGPLF
jgi:hypothetical protein